MADIFTAVIEFINGLINVLNVFLIPAYDPATGTGDFTQLPNEPIKLLIWGALIFGFIPVLFKLILGMVNRSKSSAG